MVSKNAFIHINANNHAKYRIICIYHAGGYASQYAILSKYLPKEIELLIYERPGLGSRIGEEQCTDWEQLKRVVFTELEPYLNKPYILFGHSLGASISFELVKQLQANKLPLPINLCIGDREAPPFPYMEYVHLLEDKEFKEILINEYDMSRDLLNNEDFSSFFLPMLRVEFKLANIYYKIFNPSDELVTCPITVFIPNSSKKLEESISAWSKFTTEAFEIIRVEGGHFFPTNNTEEFVPKLIKQFNRNH